MNNTPTILTAEEVDQRFDMSRYSIMKSHGYSRMIFYEGDTTISGYLCAEWAIEVLEELKEDTSLYDVLVMVNGNLTVEKDIYIEEYRPLLLVLGNVFCDVLKSSDDTIHITGDAHIKYVFTGMYNDGSITIEGATHVPYILNFDHSSAITPHGAVLIDPYGDGNRSFKYDYTQKDLPRVIISEAFEGNDFLEHKFISIVRSGRSPLVEGAMPDRLKS